MEGCVPSRRKTILLVSYIVLLFAGSLVPMSFDAGTPDFLMQLSPTMQNLLHIPLFMGLAILWVQVLGRYNATARFKLPLALCFTMLLGVANEYLQLHVDGRYASLTDIIMNGIGALLGAALYRRLESSSPNFLKKLVCE